MCSSRTKPSLKKIKKWYFLLRQHWEEAQYSKNGRTIKTTEIQVPLQVSLHLNSKPAFCTWQFLSSCFKLRLRDWQQVPPEPCLFRFTSRCLHVAGSMTAHLTFQVLWDSLMRSLEPTTPPFLQARALSNSRRTVFVLPRTVERERDLRWLFFSGFLTCCYTLNETHFC